METRQQLEEQAERLVQTLPPEKAAVMYAFLLDYIDKAMDPNRRAVKMLFRDGKPIKDSQPAA